LRIIAVSFFALANYITVDAARALAGTGEAQHSLPGIVLAVLSLAIMPFLSAAQRRAGRELGSATAVAESKTPPPRPPWPRHCRPSLHPVGC
jgi:divalent metal cation (Fe/Co/Zn/Cd) transporter